MTDEGLHSEENLDRSDDLFPTQRHRLHRLAEVRQLQGLSRHTVARQLDTDPEDVEFQEQPTTDLPLSTLYRWQSVLGVPISELLEKGEESLSAPVLKRTQLLRLMEIAAAIRSGADHPAIQRMAQVLVDQLIDIMPELASVSAWHAVNTQPSQDDSGPQDPDSPATD